MRGRHWAASNSQARYSIGVMESAKVPCVSLCDWEAPEQRMAREHAAHDRRLARRIPSLPREKLYKRALFLNEMPLYCPLNSQQPLLFLSFSLYFCSLVE